MRTDFYTFLFALDISESCPHTQEIGGVHRGDRQGQRLRGATGKFSECLLALLGASMAIIDGSVLCVTGKCKVNVGVRTWVSASIHVRLYTGV